MNRPRPVPYTFTRQAAAELRIELPKTLLEKRLDELVVAEEKRDAAMQAWLKTPSGSVESAEAHAVLQNLEIRVLEAATYVAFLWSQENK